jgi:hypothetical protein
MNQSLLQADVLLCDHVREREKHIEEGRILRALQAPALGRTSGWQASSSGDVDQPAELRARISRLWSSLWIPAPRCEPGPLHADCPLVPAAE